MGDEAFFSRLNTGKKNGGGGWGELEREWDSRRFESALAAAGSEDRAAASPDAAVFLTISPLGDVYERYHRAHEPALFNQDLGTLLGS